MKIKEYRVAYIKETKYLTYKPFVCTSRTLKWKKEAINQQNCPEYAAKNPETQNPSLLKYPFILYYAQDTKEHYKLRPIKALYWLFVSSVWLSYRGP